MSSSLPIASNREDMAICLRDGMYDPSVRRIRPDTRTSGNSSPGSCASRVARISRSTLEAVGFPIGFCSRSNASCLDSSVETNPADPGASVTCATPAAWSTTRRIVLRTEKEIPTTPQGSTNQEKYIREYPDFPRQTESSNMQMKQTQTECQARTN